MDLFQYAEEQRQQLGAKPLAELLRPTRIGELIGQQHLLGEGAPLRAMLVQRQLVSLLLWGPPGIGKTTLASLLAVEIGAHFETLSAVQAGVKEVRACIEAATQRAKHHQQRTLVFIDEIHRFNKTQQDALLPHVEKGHILLVGATTENPYFSVNPALRSRLWQLQLHPLNEEDLNQLLKRSLQALRTYSPELNVRLHKQAYGFFIRHAGGDARSLITLLEVAYWCAPRHTLEGEAGNSCIITPELLAEIAPNAHRNSGKAGAGDSHYDLASAYQKSMRASDVDAALYWLAKLIAYGEDPRFIARRLVVCAAEDVGLADPQAFILAQQAATAVQQLGLPEGRIPLGLATAYVAKAPKSNASYKALDVAIADVNAGHDYPVPLHLRDAHYEGAKALGHGVDYHYPHNNPTLKQPCLPVELQGRTPLYFSE